MKVLISLTAAAVVVAVVIAALPPSSADAHCLIVTPPGHGAPVVECNAHSGDFAGGWAGSPLFPGDHPGQGLIPGGPFGTHKMSPSHDGGLVAACEAQRSHGNGVADVFGPGGAGCPHGE